MGKEISFRRKRQTFWESAAPEKGAPAQEQDCRRRQRFPSRAWNAKVSLSKTTLGLGSAPTIDVQMLDLSEGGVRLIVPKEMARGTSFRVRIEDPDFHEVIEATACVVWATPPPPVANTWVVGAQFEGLEHQDELRIAKWRFHYTSKDLAKNTPPPTPAP